MRRKIATLKKRRGQAKKRAAAQELSTELISAAQQVATLAQVSNARRRAELAAQIVRLVESNWDYSRWQRWLRWCNKIKVKERHLKAAAFAFVNAAAKLRAALDDYYKIRPRIVFYDSMDTMLREVKFWASYENLLAPPRRGRPPGTSDIVLLWFATDLLNLVKHAGGRLTFDKNYPKNRTLLRALQQLHPHLPPGLFSESPSIRVLLRAKRKISDRNGNKYLQGTIFRAYTDGTV